MCITYFTRCLVLLWLKEKVHQVDTVLQVLDYFLGWMLLGLHLFVYTSRLPNFLLLFVCLICLPHGRHERECSWKCQRCETIRPTLTFLRAASRYETIRAPLTFSHQGSMRKSLLGLRTVCWSLDRSIVKHPFHWFDVFHHPFIGTICLKIRGLNSLVAFFWTWPLVLVTVRL